MTLVVTVFLKKIVAYICLTLAHLQSIFKSQTPVSLKYIYPLGKGCLLERTCSMRWLICGSRSWALTKDLLCARLDCVKDPQKGSWPCPQGVSNRLETYVQVGETPYLRNQAWPSSDTRTMCHFLKVRVIEATQLSIT